MTTHDALLAAVLAAPDDDTVRKAFADYCRENGQEERADFIEVQLRIAEIRRECSCGECVRLRGGGQHTNGGCAVDRERLVLPDGSSRQAFLRRREQELLDKHAYQWFPPPLVACLSDTGTLFKNATPGMVAAHVTRGFVSKVACTDAEWRGCQECGGAAPRPVTSGPVRITFGGGATATATSMTRACGVCRGRGQAIGPAVVRSHPVTRVVPAGVEPHENPLGQSIFNRIEDHEAAEHPSELPAKIFDLIGATAEVRPSSARATIKRFATREAAFSALSAALILWAKSENDRQKRRADDKAGFERIRAAQDQLAATIT